MARLEKNTEKFIQKMAAQGGQPIYKMKVADARKVLEGLQEEPGEKLPVLIEEVMVPGGPKKEVLCRIVRPVEGNEKLPIIMYFHGGGWILGNGKTHDRLVREIATRCHAAVVFVEYSPSPETQYPVPIEEAYAATKYFAEEGRSFNLDSSRMAVAGDSVGGNMAAVVAILAKERGGPKIDFQVLLYPVTDANFDNGSYREFAEGPWLTKKSMEWFWNAYAPNVKDRTKYTASPLRATLDQLKNLPPALVITDENDVLRDEGEAYAHRLMEAGVEATVIRYLGAMHDFLMLNALKETPAAKSALALTVAHLKKAFMYQKTAQKKKAA